MKNTTGVTIIGVLILIVLGFLLWNYKNKEVVVVTVPESPLVVSTSNTTTIPTQGGAPMLVTSPNVSTTYMTALVNGTVNPNNSFTSYWYEYGLTNTLGSKSVSQQIGSGYYSIDAPTYITSLTKNTVYYFRLVAENQYGKVNGTMYSFQTNRDNPLPVGTAPKATTGTALNISKTGATLNGQVNPSQSDTKYWFEYGTTANLGSISPFASAGNGNANVSAAVVLTDLVPGTTYFFRVNAQNQFSTVNGGILTFKTSSAVVNVKVN
jgi:hypothetical protein